MWRNPLSEFRITGAGQVSGPRPSFRPAVEALEERMVLQASPISISIPLPTPPSGKAPEIVGAIAVRSVYLDFFKALWLPKATPADTRVARDSAKLSWQIANGVFDKLRAQSNPTSYRFRVLQQDMLWLKEAIIENNGWAFTPNQMAHQYRDDANRILTDLRKGKLTQQEATGVATDLTTEFRQLVTFLQQNKGTIGAVPDGLVGVWYGQFQHLRNEIYGNTGH